MSWDRLRNVQTEPGQRDLSFEAPAGSRPPVPAAEGAEPPPPPEGPPPMPTDRTLDAKAGRRLTGAEHAQLDAARKLLRRTYNERTESGGRVVALSDHCARAMRRSAADSGLPVGAAAEWAAWCELGEACHATGNPWPAGPKKFARAAEIVARARAQAGALYEARALPARHGVQVVAHGIDSLYLNVFSDLRPDVIATLAGLSDLARLLPAQDWWVGSGLHRWRVEAWGGGAPFAFMLRGPSSTIRIARNSSTKSPQCYVELRSGWLWRLGPDRAVAEVLTVLRAWSQPGEPRVTVSRIDLAVDAQGLDLTGEELAGGLWVSRSLGRSGYWAAQRLDRETEPEAEGAAEEVARGKRQAVKERHWLQAEAAAGLYWHGRVHTGAMFGAGGRLSVRYYRKDIEIRRKAGGAVWLPALWSQCPAYREAAPVWRFEAQIRGEALKQFVGEVAHLEGGAARARATNLHEWRHLRRALGALWRYVVGDPGDEAGGWLSLRERGEHARAARWPVDRRWRAVQLAPFGVGVGSSVRACDVLADAAAVRRLAGRRVSAVQTDALEAGAFSAELWEAAQAAACPVGEHGIVFEPSDAATLAQVIARPEVLRAWGRGPGRDGAARLAAAGLEVVTGEQRASALEAQTVGTIAALVGAVLDTGAHAGRPAAEVAGEILYRAIRRQGADFGGKVAGARARAGLRGALAASRQVIQDAELEEVAD